MFIDEAKIYVKAGDGGKGCQSIYRDKLNRIGRPDGGPGGDGGNVIFVADSNMHTLLDFRYNQHIKAHSGLHGSSNHKKGHRGADLFVKVPPGTILKDAVHGFVLRDLVAPGDTCIAAKGGEGGRGNSRGRDATAGAPGEERTVLLELKLIADVGIIGYPNAGKSTLISRISSAHPKIADYPFTTIAPVLGVVQAHQDAHMVVAEIPGLIEGAHEGKGLGDRFLRHVERTKALIHLVDIAAFEGRDPCADYKTLNRELAQYSKELSKKPQIIALNKTDLPDAKGHIKKFKKKHPRAKVFPISGATGEGLKELVEAVYRMVKKRKTT